MGKKLFKQMIPFISLAAIIGAASSNFVSINIGDQNGHLFLEKLKDFDWKNIDLGDGIEYDNHNSKAIAKSKISNIIENSKAQKIVSSHEGRYIDYSNFATGYKYIDSIKKQAVTGIPLNWGFMPNGNTPSDFGVTSRAQKFSQINSILNWNPGNDKDAKYNRSYVPLRKSTFTAFYNPAKKYDMEFNDLGYSTRTQSTFDNTVVGTKNPLEGTNLNWQYTSNFVNWSGSWQGGIITPPPADIIDMAHNNGTPIYGNIYFDGWYGLDKETLRDFVKKDRDGNYLAVDFLLNLANYGGFDGYFINDESNGSGPNGTVLDYHVLVDIVKQFNAKSAEKNLNKKIIFYKNGATLAKRDNEYEEPETYAMTKTGFNGKAQDIQFEFDETPDQSKDFRAEHGNYHPDNLFTMHDMGGLDFTVGTYDWRQIACDPNDPDDYTSVSGFMNGGGVNFANAALDLIKYKNDDSKKKERDFVFANQVSNLYNDILFNGTNTNITNKENGYVWSNGWKGDANYTQLGDSGNTEQRFVLDDPRIGINSKEELKAKYKTGDVAKYKDLASNIYNYSGVGKGRNTNSYGVGNLIQEKTVFEDEDDNNAPIKTDFSTGSGIKFVDRDANGAPSVTEDYPYTNRRIADILPTYQWEINEISNSASLNDIDPLNTSKPKITDLNGFYDYDDPYSKSNSLALGSKFDQEGKIQDGHWDANKKYIWNIMGTNLSKNHNFSLTYKDSKNENGKEEGIDKQADVVPVLTFTKDGINKYVELKKASGNNQDDACFTEEEPTEDGWKTIRFNLDGTGISSKKRLAKIGLLISPKNKDFKFNVGEFSMDDNENEENLNSISSKLSNFISEYRIERGNLINLRFNYETKPDFDYIEFYIKDKTGKWFRVGETTTDEYFIKDINKVQFGEYIDLAAVSYKNNRVVGSDRYEIK